MNWIKKIFFTVKANEKVEPENPVAMAEAILSETEEILKKYESLVSEVSNLSTDEQAWMEWFLSLPENHKKIVETCAKNGIQVNRDNFDSILKTLSRDQS